MKKVDHDERRARIAAAAATIIAEEGMEALTTRRLASTLDCSIGVLAHYFKSKDHILLAAFDWADTNINRRMEAVMSERPTLDAFVPVIRAGLPLTPETDREWRVRFCLYSYNLTDSQGLVDQNAKLKRFREIMSRLISQMQKEGEIRCDLSAEEITSASFDLIIGAAQHMLMLPMKERESSTHTIFRLLEGLRVRQVEPVSAHASRTNGG